MTNKQPERDGPIARHQRHHALPAGGARVERRDEQQRSNQHELDDGQPEVELLHDDHLVELIGRIEHADEQHRGHAGGHGGHQEQNRQKRAVPQGESLAHAKQAAGVNGDAQAHDEPHAIEPHRHLALHQIKHQHDERDDHEHRQKHHAPGHDRPEVREQKREAQRMGEARGSVEHQQAQTDDDHDRRDEASDAHEALALRMAVADEHRRCERAAAQAGQEEVPRDDGAPNGFVDHVNHLT